MCSVDACSAAFDERVSRGLGAASQRNSLPATLFVELNVVGDERAGFVKLDSSAVR